MVWAAITPKSRQSHLTEARSACQAGQEGNAVAHHWLANIPLAGYGRRDEALREQVIAARLDPLSPVPTGTLGWHRYLRGELTLSRAEYERAVDLQPSGSAPCRSAWRWRGPASATPSGRSAGSSGSRSSSGGDTRFADVVRRVREAWRPEWAQRQAGAAGGADRMSARAGNPAEGEWSGTGPFPTRRLPCAAHSWAPHSPC
jgi:hypothetical protein